MTQHEDPNVSKSRLEKKLPSPTLKSYPQVLFHLMKTETLQNYDFVSEKYFFVEAMSAAIC